MNNRIASINNGEITVTEKTPSCSEGAAAGIALASMALCGLPFAPSTESSYEVNTPDGCSKFRDRDAALDFAARQAR